MLTRCNISFIIRSIHEEGDAMSGRRMRESRRFSGGRGKSLALPDDTHTPNTEDETIVKLILERARVLAKDVQIGTEVSVDVKELFGELSTDLHAIVGKVMYYADEYGLLPGTFESHTFYFIKM